MRKYQIALLLSAIMLLLSMMLSLLVWMELPRTERILIDTDTLRAVQNGGEISVYDVVGDKQYTFFRIKHKRPSEGRTMPITVSQDGANIVVKVAEKRIEILDTLNNKRYVLRIGKILSKITLCS